MTIPGQRKNWVAPLEFAGDPRYIFGGSEFVSRMDTEPATLPRVWQTIGADLTEGTEPRAPGFGTITAIGTTRADPNLVYAGTDSGLMWVSHNAMAGVYGTNLGKTWIKVGDNLVPVNDIDLPGGSETLFAATYGRSVWTTSLADIMS
jgi:hypothetical protein